MLQVMIHWFVLCSCFGPYDRPANGKIPQRQIRKLLDHFVRWLDYRQFTFAHRTEAQHIGRIFTASKMIIQPPRLAFVA